MKAVVYFLVMLLLAFTVSCGKVSEKPIPSHMTINAERVIKLIEEETKSPIILVKYLDDMDYVLPTEEWVKKEFTKTLDQFLFDYNLETPIDQSRDCDDYAAFGVNIAHALNKKTEAGVAVGEFGYFSGGFIPHVINVIVVADKNQKPKVLFYEPQTREIIQLTPEEKETCLSFVF